MWVQNKERRESPESGRTRAQSETVGFILLFSLVLIGAGTIIAFGAVAVSDSEQRLSADRAEKVMTQMDSEISMVALGRTDSQDMEFDRASGEEFTVDGDAGVINITTVGDSSTVIMPDTNLGAITFERGKTKIAYQGGGVWRTDGQGGSGMVSPPEFNYREQTLTLPLVTISGDRSLDSGAIVEKDGASTRYFPNATNGLSNPLEDEVVQVTVESEYHQGWKSYFETRTEGAVTHTPAENRVRVNLTAPAIVDFKYGAMTTQKNGLSSKSNGEVIGGDREGVQSDSISPTVEDEVSDCGSCTTVSQFDSTVTAGRYYADTGTGLDVEDGTVFDTSDGDIEIIVEDDLDFEGNNKKDHVITGNGQVRFYVNGTVTDIHINGQTNVDGDAEDLLMFVHSDVDSIDLTGKKAFTGFIYAPNTDFVIAGGGGKKTNDNVVGGVVANTIDVSNGGIVHENNNNFAVEVGGRTNPLTFLHISVNPVTVRSR